MDIDFTLSHLWAWHKTKLTVIGCFTYHSDSPWPRKAAIETRSSAIMTRLCKVSRCNLHLKTAVSHSWFKWVEVFTSIHYQIIWYFSYTKFSEHKKTTTTVSEIWAVDSPCTLHWCICPASRPGSACRRWQQGNVRCRSCSPQPDSSKHTVSLHLKNTQSLLSNSSRTPMGLFNQVIDCSQGPRELLYTPRSV